MEDGNSAASGIRSSTHLWPVTLKWGTPRNQEVIGESAGFLLGFGSDFAMWILISGLRVLSVSGGL